MKVFMILRIVALVPVAILALVAAYSYSYRPLSEEARVNGILIEKEERRLILKYNGVAIKSYEISLGGEPVGRKLFEGDGKTPEGLYTIDRRNDGSRYHLALHISYPTAEDLAYAESHGRSAGGDIMIHGLPNGLGFFGPLHTAGDWTDGCIAVTNAEIEEIWRAVPDGTPVEIRP